MRIFQIIIFTVLALLFLAMEVHAQVLGPSVREVRFSYEAQFLTDESLDLQQQARDHASYMFGLLQTQQLVENYGLDHDLIGGLGAPRDSMNIQVTAKKKMSDGKILLRYKNSGKMLLERTSAAKILRSQKLRLPMPYDLALIYDKKCTDPNYDSEGDYWYFWNPYPSHCEYLLDTPYTQEVSIEIQDNSTKVKDLTPRLDLLRADNGNGELFSIYVVHGFDESNQNPKDLGRKNAKELDAYLKDTGFELEIADKNKKRPLKIFRKEITLLNGKAIQVEIRHLLVDTNIESRSTGFAKFFKEAVREADVIVYEGHSGLGGNLDIQSLESKVGEFQFNSQKRQIYFFDSCSSYSYYLDSFAEQKTRAKIDILTNGLTSEFTHSTLILTNFLDALLDESAKDVPWMSILKKMEEPLEGGSYLLNVGGI